MTKKNGFLVALGLALGATVAPSTAFAQTVLPAAPPVTVNYAFDLPLARVTPNPCTGGFTLISGSLHLALATTAATGYQISAKLASDGNGIDALADGTPAGGTSQYLYGSDAGVSATFPDGVPEYYETTLPINDFLIRDSAVETNDAYTMSTTIRLIFSNGLPSVPTLDSVSVACQ